MPAVSGKLMLPEAYMCPCRTCFEFHACDLPTGHRPRFFSLMDDGMAKTELECQTPGSALGRGPHSAKGSRGFAFSPVKLPEEELTEAKSETEADEGEVRGAGDGKEADSRPSGGKDAENAFKQFLEERMGLECSIS